MAIERHIKTDAIILKTKISGEINKNFIFISPDIGINTATAFGAAKIKSRFCSTVEPFVTAGLFLYKNPNSSFYKLEDISNIISNDFIKNDLNYIYLTSFFAEILIDSYITQEEYKSYFYMLMYSLEILKEKSDLKNAFLFFTSKFLFLVGYNFDLKVCQKCNNTFNKYYFDFHRGGCFCDMHANNKEYLLLMKSASLWNEFLEKRYIYLKELSINDEDFKSLYRIIIYILINIFEKKLKTIEYINSIFC